jgi:hypothetical protein
MARDLAFQCGGVYLPCKYKCTPLVETSFIQWLKQLIDVLLSTHYTRRPTYRAFSCKLKSHKTSNSKELVSGAIGQRCSSLGQFHDLYNICKDECRCHYLRRPLRSMHRNRTAIKSRALSARPNSRKFSFQLLLDIHKPSQGRVQGHDFHPSSGQQTSRQDRSISQ